MTHRRRNAWVAAGLAAILGGVVITAGPAAAISMLGRSVTPALPVTTGFLSYIRGFSSATLSTGGGVTITLAGQGPSAQIHLTGAGHDLTLALKAPNGADLAVGTYVDATREPFSAPGEPGFEFAGDGGSCNVLRAEFTVHRITMDGDHVIQALDASFVQHCEGFTALDRGRIVLDLEPLPTAAENGTFILGGGDEFASGQYLFASAQDIVAAQVERHGNSIFVAARRPNFESLGDWWDLEARAPVGQAITAGTTYTAATQNATATKPGLSLTSIQRRSCDIEVGSFTVHKLHVAEDGSVDLLDLIFQRRCNGTFLGFGRVLINAALPSLTSSIALSATGTLRRTRLAITAEVRGTITCSDWAKYDMAGTVTQIVNGVQISKVIATTVECQPGTVSWSAFATSKVVGGFRAGTATVTMTAHPANAFLYSPTPPPVQGSRTVTLPTLVTPRRSLPFDELG